MFSADRSRPPSNPHTNIRHLLRSPRTTTVPERHLWTLSKCDRMVSASMDADTERPYGLKFPENSWNNPQRSFTQTCSGSSSLEIRPNLWLFETEERNAGKRPFSLHFITLQTTGVGEEICTHFRSLDKRLANVLSGFWGCSLLAGLEFKCLKPHSKHSEI